MDIRAALRTIVYENDQPHGTTIYLGYSRDLELLEIGVAYDDERNGVVIHAMPAQQKYLDDYREQRR